MKQPDSERFRSTPRTCEPLPGHAEPAVSWQQPSEIDPRILAGSKRPAPDPSGYDCELAHTRSGLRAIFLTPKGLLLGMGAISGDLVSQRREKPNARSQNSFDQNESESAR
jgi:hypothetical protein